MKEKNLLLCIAVSSTIIWIGIMLSAQNGLSGFSGFIWLFNLCLSIYSWCGLADRVAEFEWKNLAPNLIRQRCKIEILVDHVVTPEEIKDFLPKLSEVLGMQMLEVSAYEAVIDGKFVGYGGWIHWVTSGAHVYSYTAEKTQQENWCLFSIDPYTCRPFDLDKAYQFTKEYFNVPEERIAAKEC